MIISFFGHSVFIATCQLKKKLFDILNNEAFDKSVDFYLGGYGEFDSFAKSVCLEFQKINKKVKICFVTPYVEQKYLKKRQGIYDEIIAPDNVEKFVKKFAIIKRNEWIVDKSDLIIAYVNCSVGGAYNAIKYANKTNKKVVNLA